MAMMLDGEATAAAIKSELSARVARLKELGVEPGLRTWQTREELRIAIVTWIERTYHRRRRQVTLGRLTPIEYEIIMTARTTQAA